MKSVKAPPLLNAPFNRDKKLRYKIGCSESCTVVAATLLNKGPYIDIAGSSRNSLVSFQMSNLLCLSGKPFFAISLHMASKALCEQKGMETLKSLILLFLGFDSSEAIAHEKVAMLMQLQLVLSNTT